MALREGSRVFLRFDSPSKGRVLQAGVLESLGDDCWKLAFDSRHHPVEDGEHKLVYYNRARDFVQQPVVVESQSLEGPPYVLVVRSDGEPISAGTREEDRVETGDFGLAATLEDEPNCPVQDVSLSGLAVLARQTHHVGRSLEIAIRYGDEEFVGEVEVQSAVPVGEGRVRYGLLGVFDTAQGRNLQNGLTKMTLEIQRRQLERRSRRD